VSWRVGFRKRCLPALRARQISAVWDMQVPCLAVLLLGGEFKVQTKRLPSDEEMGRLKRELNFLLWTDDVPEVPTGTPSVLGPEIVREGGGVNIQCAAHALVTGGLFMRRGLRITTRAGRAIVIEASRDKRSGKERIEEIARHWWLTLDDYGAVDLSLCGEGEHPLVYCNRCPGGLWDVEFGDNRKKLERFVRARQQGVFYLTSNKKRATYAEMADGLEQTFPPARRDGFEVRYATVLEHCESLLTGTAATLSGLLQREAWKRLAR